MPTVSALCVINNGTCITIIPALPYFVDMVMGKYSHTRFVRGGFFKERTGINSKKKEKKTRRWKQHCLQHFSLNGTQFILLCRATLTSILDNWFYTVRMNHTPMFNWGSDPPNTQRGAWGLELPFLSLFLSAWLQILYFDRQSREIPAQNTSSSQLLDYLKVISLPQNILSNHWLHFSIYFTINASSLTEQLSDEFWNPINIFSWPTWAVCVFYSSGKTSLIPPVSCLSIILKDYQSHLAGR